MPQTSRLKSLFGNVLIFIALLLGAEWWQGSKMRSGAWPETAKSLATLDGNPFVVLGKQKLTLVYVFAPWCGVCRATAGNLNALTERGLNVVSLALAWEQKSEIDDFVRSTGLSASVLVGNDEVARELSVNAFPSYFILSPSGQILKAWSGYSTTIGLLLKMWAYRLTTLS